MSIVIREQAPPLSITTVMPGGEQYRWGSDGPGGGDTPSGLQFSSVMPGGSDTLTCTLPRDPSLDYPDLSLLSELRIDRQGGRGQSFRLQEVPRVSGNQMAVEPAAVGYRAQLEDRQDVRVLYVDRDLSNWGGMSPARRMVHLAGDRRAEDAVIVTGQGNPEIELPADGRWLAAGFYAEALYDAGSAEITALYSNWRDENVGSPFNARFGGADTHDEDGSTWEPSTDLASGSATGTVSATLTGGPYRYARMDVALLAVATTDTPRRWFHQNVAVYGKSGLTPQGADPGGFYTGPMLEHLVAQKAGLGIGTIEDGSFLHLHASYLTPSSSLSIIQDLIRVEPMYEWAVWGKDFSFTRRGNSGRVWKARIGPSGLTDSGASLERRFNQVAVKANDPVLGADIVVGPTGSAHPYTDVSLVDNDPDNPCNRAGIVRTALVDAGLTTLAGATEIGRRFLSESATASTSGACTLTGYVEAKDGTVWPVDEVRAGDRVVFTDAADRRERHIARATYSADSRSVSLDLDSEPLTMDALLARLSAVIINL